MHKAIIRLIPTAFPVAMAILASGSPAFADVTTAYWVNYQNWGYRITHMPDFDQRRQVGATVVGLPGDGSMYCAPTSALNICAYAANHGFTYVMPGPSWWQSQAKYNDATVAIFNLGADMNTHPTDGTGGDWHPGFKQWLKDSASNAGTNEKLTVSGYFITNSFTPSLDQLAHTAVDGSVITLAYGRYDISGVLLGLPRIVGRSGGHAVTLAETFGVAPSSLTLGVRDPADDPDGGTDPLYKQSQSTFSTRFYDTEHLPVHFDIWGVGARIMAALNYTDGNDRVALVDAYLGVKPKSGYSFTSGGGAIYKLFLYKPFKFLGDISPNLQEFILPAGPPVGGVAVHPDLAKYYVLREGDSGGGTPARLEEVDCVTGDMTDVLDLPDAADICVSRHRDVYYITVTGEICCMNPDTGDIIGCESVGGTANAICADDDDDKIVVLSSSEHVLALFDPGLPAGGPQLLFLPGSVPLGTNASLATIPSLSGAKPPCLQAFVTDASDSIFIAAPAAPLAGEAQVTELSFPEIVSPTCISFDDAGRMFVVAEGGLFELLFDGDTQEWGLVPDEQKEFGEFAVGDCFYVTRSRTNKTSIHQEWTNIDPDTGELEDGEIVLDCPADFNNDRIVDVADLLQLLADWGPCDVCVSDTNDDRIIDVADLLALLGAWGDCT